MVELKKVGNYIFRGMSILGATGVLLGGIVLLSKPQNLLANSAVWSIPYIGSSLKWFWEWPLDYCRYHNYKSKIGRIRFDDYWFELFQSASCRCVGYFANLIWRVSHKRSSHVFERV